MDKRIIVGLVAGLILGVIEMFAFGGGAIQVVLDFRHKGTIRTMQT